MTIAVRRHFKYLVKDEYGNAISNAQVFVYQPGTTTNFLGTAYTTLSGGTTTTNPFTSNSQGEIEAWFDTPQAVDLLITDNSDAAIRAGYSTPISFTSFTEFGLIGTGIEGTAGTITTIEVGDSAAAGSSTIAAAGDHNHPVTAPAAPVVQRTTAAAGSAVTIARSDHIHGFVANTGKTSKFATASDTNEQLIQSYTVAAGTLTAGSQFKITLKGHQTNGTTACTYTFRVRWGGLAGTQLHSIAFVGTTTAHTDNPHHMDYLVNFQAVGASGSAVVQVSGDECITTTTANTPKLIVDPQTTAVGSLDTTTAKDLSVTVQMNTTTGTPNFEIDNILIEQAG